MRSASSLLISTKRTKGFYHWNVTQEILTYDFTTFHRTQMRTVLNNWKKRPYYLMIWTCIKPVIENAHRIGGPRTGASNDPRHVIAKFIYRLERLKVIQKKRSLKNDSPWARKWNPPPPPPPSGTFADIHHFKAKRWVNLFWNTITDKNNTQSYLR